MNVQHDTRRQALLTLKNRDDLPVEGNLAAGLDLNPASGANGGLVHAPEPINSPRRLRALSVRQPWASLIASGQKTIEVRSRKTHHRGELLICAALGGCVPLYDNLPAGVALCIVNVVDCRPMVKADEAAAGVALRPGHYAWILENSRYVPPQRVRGNTGIFYVDLLPAA